MTNYTAVDDQLLRVAGEFVTGGPVLTSANRSARRRMAHMAGRVGSVGAALAVGQATRWDPQAAQAVAGSALPWGYATASAVLAARGWTAADRHRARVHRARWVVPLHIALCEDAGWDTSTRPESYLRVSPEFAHAPGGVRVRVPASWGEKQIRAHGEDVVKTVRRVLALGGPDRTKAKWVMEGPHSFLQITPVEAVIMPALASVTDRDEAVRDRISAALLASPEPAPLIGFSEGWKPVRVNLDDESPHILVSAGTGGGKSVILSTITAQMMRHGALVDVFDYKLSSQAWLAGLDGVGYWRDIGEMHGALVRLGKEARARQQLVREHAESGADGDPDVGPRRLLLVEESNATIGKLARWWKRNRTSDDEKESPAVEALHDILFMGRAVKVHVLMVAQSATARALGGPEVRECFGACRILARATRKAWNMLADEISPTPVSESHTGRCHVVIGGTAHRTQVVFFSKPTEAKSGNELRKWALSGTRPAMTPRRAHHGPRGVRPSLELVKPDDGRVTLRQAAADTGQGVVRLNHEHLRKKARYAGTPDATDPEFPPPVGQRKVQGGTADEFDVDELRSWDANRDPVDMDETEEAPA